MAVKPTNITVTTDGGASPSSGPWCQYAAILQMVDSQGEVHYKIIRGQEPGTNNVGEMLAVIKALEAIKGDRHVITIRVDSLYVKNGVEKWMPAWKKKGWRKADGDPVANELLWKRLDQLTSNGSVVRFEHVAGHSGDRLNELCDTIVNEVRLHNGDLTKCTISEKDI